MNVGPVLVLDIGTSKVSLLVAELNSQGGLEAMDLAVAQNRGVQRGVVIDLDETSRAIDEVLRSVRGGIDAPRELVVSVNGGHLEGVNSQGFLPVFPPHRSIHREDVLHVVNHSRQVAPSPDREQIMAIPREFRVDGQRGVRRPVGMSGSRLEVLTHLITGQIAHLHNVERAVEMTGYKVSQMVPAPFAGGYALLSEEERESGCVVVDLGAGTTGVAIFAGGSLAGTASVPIGGWHVANDLSKLLKTSMDEAEALKKNCGRAIVANVKDDAVVEVRQIGSIEPRMLQKKVLYEIIESRMREIATLVRHQIERSSMFGMLPGGVVLTGGGSHMPGVPQLFAKVLRDTNVRIAAPRIEGPAGHRTSAPEYAVLVGLAKHALTGHEDEVSPAAGFLNWKERIMTLFQLKV